MPPKEKQDPNEEEEIETQEDETEEEDLETEEQEETEEEEDLSPEALREKYLQARAELKKTRKEARARRLKLKELEQKEKERADAELSEAEKLKKDLSDRDSELETLRQEKRSLLLSQELGKQVRKLRVEFISETAREDAIAILQNEDLGEDFEDLEQAIKDLVKDRNYYFKKADPNQFIEDGRKKTKVTPRTVAQQTVNQKRRRVGGL
jgi:hypothetical protein